MLLLDLVPIMELPFYSKPDFYIFLILGGFSLYYSIVSWKEAKGAKAAAEQAEKAAEKATRKVKYQEIQMDIFEIGTVIQLIDINDKYEKINSQLTTIIAKTSHVIGVVKEDNALNAAQQNLIAEVEKLIGSLQNTFKASNPFYIQADIQTNTNAIQGAIYLSLCQSCKF